MVNCFFDLLFPGIVGDRFIMSMIHQDIENQMQQDSETAREQITSLEDQLQAEKRRRDDADIEISKQKQVLN